MADSPMFFFVFSFFGGVHQGSGVLTCFNPLRPSDEVTVTTYRSPPPPFGAFFPESNQKHHPGPSIGVGVGGVS